MTSIYYLSPIYRYFHSTYSICPAIDPPHVTLSPPTTNPSPSPLHPRYDPAIQADGESLKDLQAVLTARYPQILTSILQDESYSAARALLGTSYHSIQKFYSHSTWVEQGNVGILEGLGIPGSELGDLAGESDNVCTSCDSPQVSTFLAD